MPWPDDLYDLVFMPHTNETLDELVLQVRIALGEANVNASSAADGNNDRQVTVEEIVRSVTLALLGLRVNYRSCGRFWTSLASPRLDPRRSSPAPEGITIRWESTIPAIR